MYGGDNAKNGRFPMTRIARCYCGSLRAEVTGEPWIVAICHCTECQRRTGSAFGASAHFPKEQVRIEGPSKVYVCASDSGRKVQFHFCPDCGTSVFWYAEVRPNHIGIASGTFADPLMPWPTVSIWDDAASVGDLRSPGRSVYRPIIDTGNTRNRLMRTPTISDDV
jgi:hypothetical protein